MGRYQISSFWPFDRMFGCFGTLRDHFFWFVFCFFESRQCKLWMFSVLSLATGQEWQQDYASVWLKWWTANVKTHYGTPANQEPGLCGGTAEDDDVRVRWARKRSQMLCFCVFRRVCVTLRCQLSLSFSLRFFKTKITNGLPQCRVTCRCSQCVMSYPVCEWACVLSVRQSLFFS